MEFLLLILVVAICMGIMCVMHIFYDIASLILPIFAVVLIIIGIIVGFCVAIKNMISVLRTIWTKEDKTV